MLINNRFSKTKIVSKNCAAVTREARLNESFIVLTVGASLIASLGLVADNNAVIIGAMVVAPWILPLRVAVFAILIGQARLCLLYTSDAADE